MKIVMFFCGLCLLWLSGCTSLLNLKKPTAELNRVFARDANLTGTTLVFVVDVENPNDRELKVDEIAYKVFLSGKEFAHAKTDREVTVAAHGKSQVEVPLPVQYTNLLSSLSEILLNGEVTYKIEGDAKLSVFRIPFNKEGKVNLRGD